MLDADKNTIGHISVMDSKPVPRDEQTISLLKIFAARAGFELQRMQIQTSAKSLLSASSNLAIKIPLH